MPPKELPIPDPALRDPNSVEMIRAWIAEKDLHCSIHVGMYHEMFEKEFDEEPLNLQGGFVRKH